MFRFYKTIFLFLASCSSIYAWSFFGSSQPTEEQGERGECVLWMPVTGADPATFNLVPLITAEGNTFEPDDLVATHATLPVGSYVRVTNIRNEQFVDVRIGGRPSIPVIGRILELSKGAFEVVAHISEGTFPGLVSPITRPPLSSGNLGGYQQPGVNNYPQTGVYPPTDNYNQRPGGQYDRPTYGSDSGYNNPRPSFAQPRPQGPSQGYGDYVTPQQQQGQIFNGNNYPQSSGPSSYPYPQGQY